MIQNKGFTGCLLQGHTTDPQTWINTRHNTDLLKLLLKHASAQESSIKKHICAFWHQCVS